MPSSTEMARCLHRSEATCPRRIQQTAGRDKPPEGRVVEGRLYAKEFLVLYLQIMNKAVVVIHQ